MNSAKSSPMAEENTVWETKIVNFLNDNPILRTMADVPSLTRRVRDYRSQDFREIARLIRIDRISVFTGYDSGTEDFGSYVGKTKAKGDLEDYFIFNTYAESEPINRPGTLVHEATHAIQDDRRMKLSYVESEMDAWFVTAVFALRTVAPDKKRTVAADKKRTVAADKKPGADDADETDGKLKALMAVPLSDEWAKHPVQERAVALARRFLRGESVRDAGDRITKFGDAVRAKYKNAFATDVARSGRKMHTDAEALEALDERERMNGIGR
jgi:hypothetical protein